MEEVSHEERDTVLTVLRFGQLLQQLSGYERFQLFMKANYDVGVREDEEGNAYLVAMEVPMAQAQARMQEMAMEALKEQGPEISIASEADLKRITGKK